MDEKQTTSLDWRDLQLFVAVARAGGLSPAAAATGRSPPTLSRRMLALERALAQELFVRHDKGYDLTAAGERLLNRLDAVDASVAALAPASPDAMPLVKISAGSWTSLKLARHLAQIRGKAPSFRLRLVSAEAILDLRHREVTIGFRNARPTTEGLAGRQLAKVEFAPYATPDAPDDWIAVQAQTPSARWVRQHAGQSPSLEVTHPRNALDLALAGAGRVLLPTFLAREIPELEPVGPVVDALTHRQWLVAHQDDRSLPEVRRVIDRLARLFGA